MAVIPDAGHAISASWDRTVRWWELATGHCLRVLTEHTDEVTGVALTPDASYAVSSSRDATVRLWALDWDYEFPEVLTVAAC